MSATTSEPANARGLTRALRTTLLALLGAAAGAGCRTRLGYDAGDGGSATPPSCVTGSGAWNVEVSDTPGTRSGPLGTVGSSTSLAVGSDGHAVIVYARGASDVPDGVHVATRSASGWTLQIVGSGGEDGDDADVQIDRLGHTIIAATDTTNPLLHLHLPNGTDAPLALPGGVATGVTLALDAAQQVRVAFGFSTSLVDYATYDGAAWHVEPVTPSVFVGRASIALDASGRPSVAWCSNERFEVARRADDGSWSVETVDTSSFEMVSPSLAIDSQGREHATYVDYVGEKATTLKSAVRDGTSWKIETVGCVKDPAFTSLALDSADQPHVAIAHRLASGPVEYAVRDAAGWTVETVGGDVAVSPSLALGSDGIARVSWYELSSGTVRYAARR